MADLVKRVGATRYCFEWIPPGEELYRLGAADITGGKAAGWFESSATATVTPAWAIVGKPESLMDGCSGFWHYRASPF